MSLDVKLKKIKKKLMYIWLWVSAYRLHAISDRRPCCLSVRVEAITDICGLWYLFRVMDEEITASGSRILLPCAST